jgi:nitrite reductase (NADH) large subunit
MKKWRCIVCGYVHAGDTPPAECPVCGALAESFEPCEEVAAPPAPAVAKTWRCTACGYVHEGPEPPEQCPVCGQPKDQFEPAESPVGAPALTAKASKVVVIGAGIAGLSAAEAVRRASPGAEVTLVSEEAELPYYRLNLTRYLDGEIGAEQLTIHPLSWYTEQRVELVRGRRVSALDLRARKVTCAEGEPLSYDKLILATGARPFLPPIEGANRAGVFCLRTREDAEKILGLARSGLPCVCVGGGILGLETAAALAHRGLEVTVLDQAPWLMPRQLNRQAAAILAGHLERLGLKLCYEARTKAIVGDGPTFDVVLQDGRTFPAGLVIIAAGVRPGVELAKDAGLEVRQGVVVNDLLQTSAPDVYAAGDLAQHQDRLYGLWNAAQYQGTMAGCNAAGQVSLFGGIPRSNTLKVLGIHLTSIGLFEPEAGRDLVRQSVEPDGLIHFVFRDGRMIGAILLGERVQAGRVNKAIETKRDFSGFLSKDAPFDKLLGLIEKEPGA